MVNQVQVPDYAGTVQNAFNRRDRMQVNKQTNARADQQAQTKQYMEGRKHIIDGLQKIEDYRTNSPDGALPEMAEFQKTMVGAARTFDRMGAQMGYPPMLQDLANQVFTSPTGTQQAQNKGVLAATEANATNQNTDFALAGRGAGTQAATKTAQEAQVSAQLGTPEQLGVNASNQEAAQLSADSANRLPQARGEQSGQEEAAKRSALSALILSEAGLDPQSPEGVEAHKEIMGLGDKEYGMTIFSVAAAQAGPNVLKKIERGESLTPDELGTMESMLKRLRASDNMMAGFMAAMTGGGAPSASAGSSSSVQAEIDKLKAELADGG